MNGEQTTDFNTTLKRVSFAGEYKKSDGFLELAPSAKTSDFVINGQEGIDWFLRAHYETTDDTD